MKQRIIFFALFTINTLFPMQFLELKDGRLCSKSVVEKTVKKLHFLAYNGHIGIIALYELLQKAKNCRYIFSCGAKKLLKRYGLIDAQLHMNDMVRSIVLSSVSASSDIRTCKPTQFE